MQKSKKNKVMVAMSGGVDSSVAAYLLLKQGYDVAGATMQVGDLYNNEKNQSCGSALALEDAKNVCFKLGIPHYVFDFSKEMEENIVKNFINTYLNGRTPNPCIECNRIIKFGILLEKAISMGFDFIATGHYASILECNGNYFLAKAADKTKDQSYFLYRIKKETLPFIKFPLSNYKKQEVRDIAKQAGLSVAEKGESQEVCFITKKSYHEFIEDRIGKDFNKPGNIVNTDGKVIGKHKGVAFYTIGQRKGFGISHKAPLYVIEINVKKNEITVGERSFLARKSLIATDLNWFTDNIPQKALAKIRYNHKEAECTLTCKDSDNIDGSKEVKEVLVDFLVPQESVTPGQSIVFYDNEIVLGGGIIK